VQVSQALLYGVHGWAAKRGKGERAAELQDVGRQDIAEVMRALMFWFIFHLILKGKE
jgi:hypothetical protein